MMNIAPIIPLAGAVCNFFFAWLVFFQDRRSRANLIYLLLGSSIALWNLGCYRLFVVTTPESALIWGKVCFIGVIFTIVAFFHLTIVVTGAKTKGWIVLFYIYQMLLAGLVFTPYFIKSMLFLGTSGWYAVGGPAFLLIIPPYSLSFFSLILLWRKRRSAHRLERRRVNLLFWAQAFLFVLGINDLMPLIGFVHYPFTQKLIYPYGSLAAVFYGVIIAYSVLQYQLLDFKATMSHAAAHMVRFSFLFFISLALLLLAALFSGQFNTWSLTIAIIIMMLSASISSLLFPKLLGGGGVERLERLMLGDRFEYQDRARSFTNSLHTYDDSNLLFEHLNDLFSKTMNLASYEIILMDEASKNYTSFRAFPEKNSNNLTALNYNSPIFNSRRVLRQDHIDLAAINNQPDSKLIAELRHQFESLACEICFPMFYDDEPIGLLLLGRKRNQDPFTSTDINLMRDLSKGLCTIINQIRLKAQVLQAQEMDLLGKMSRGMAHDLNNLLTPVWTFLQLTGEGVPQADLSDDLLPVALRNLKTMRAYIREALFFSENLRPDLHSDRLDTVLAHAADLVKPRSEKQKVNVIVECSGPAEVEMDDVLIQRMMANLISNAIDASPEGWTVKVELVKLMKTEAHRDWFRIRVIDQGEGIKSENLDRVLVPYFTTKNSGDETRGFGLGLTICKKIVHLHGGHLNISSQWKKGTTVQVDLPSRQIKAAPPVALTTS